MNMSFFYLVSELDSVRLVDESSRCGGYLEFYYQKWLGVDVFDKFGADVVCRKLHCGSLKAFTNRRHQAHKILPECDTSASDPRECIFKFHYWQDTLENGYRGSLIMCSGVLTMFYLIHSFFHSVTY